MLPLFTLLTPKDMQSKFQAWGHELFCIWQCNFNEVWLLYITKDSPVTVQHSLALPNWHKYYMTSLIKGFFLHNGNTSRRHTPPQGEDPPIPTLQPTPDGQHHSPRGDMATEEKIKNGSFFMNECILSYHCAGCLNFMDNPKNIYETWAKGSMWGQLSTSSLLSQSN